MSRNIIYPGGTNRTVYQPKSPGTRCGILERYTYKTDSGELLRDAIPFEKTLRIDCDSTTDVDLVPKNQSDESDSDCQIVEIHTPTTRKKIHTYMIYSGAELEDKSQQILISDSEDENVQIKLTKLLCQGNTIHNETSFNNDIVTKDANAFNKDAKSISIDVKSPAIKPISKDIKPISKDTRPISKDVKPIGKDIKPISKDTKLISKGIKSISKGIKSMNKDIKPISKDIKPCTDLKPFKDTRLNNDSVVTNERMSASNQQKVSPMSSDDESEPAIYEISDNIRIALPKIKKKGLEPNQETLISHSKLSSLPQKGYEPQKSHMDCHELSSKPCQGCLNLQESFEARKDHVQYSESCDIKNDKCIGCLKVQDGCESSGSTRKLFSKIQRCLDFQAGCSKVWKSTTDAGECSKITKRSLSVQSRSSDVEDRSLDVSGSFPDVQTRCLGVEGRILKSPHRGLSTKKPRIEIISNVLINKGYADSTTPVFVGPVWKFQPSTPDNSIPTKNDSLHHDKLRKQPDEVTPKLKKSPRSSDDIDSIPLSKYPRLDPTLSPETMKSEFYSYLKINTNPSLRKIESTVQNRRSVRVRNLYKETERYRESGRSGSSKYKDEDKRGDRLKRVDNNKFDVSLKAFQQEDFDEFILDYFKAESIDYIHRNIHQSNKIGNETNKIIQGKNVTAKTKNTKSITDTDEVNVNKNTDKTIKFAEDQKDSYKFQKRTSIESEPTKTRKDTLKSPRTVFKEQKEYNNGTTEQSNMPINQEPPKNHKDLSKFRKDTIKTQQKESSIKNLLKRDTFKTQRGFLKAQIDSNKPLKDSKSQKDVLKDQNVVLRHAEVKTRKKDQKDELRDQKASIRNQKSLIRDQKGSVKDHKGAFKDQKGLFKDQRNSLKSPEGLKYQKDGSKMDRDQNNVFDNQINDDQKNRKSRKGDIDDQETSVSLNVLEDRKDQPKELKKRKRDESGELGKNRYELKYREKLKNQQELRNRDDKKKQNELKRRRELRSTQEGKEQLKLKNQRVPNKLGIRKRKILLRSSGRLDVTSKMHLYRMRKLRSSRQTRHSLKNAPKNIKHKTKKNVAKEERPDKKCDVEMIKDDVNSIDLNRNKKQCSVEDKTRFGVGPNCDVFTTPSTSHTSVHTLNPLDQFDLLARNYMNNRAYYSPESPEVLQEFEHNYSKKSVEKPRRTSWTIRDYDCSLLKFNESYRDRSDIYLSEDSSDGIRIGNVIENNEESSEETLQMQKRRIERIRNAKRRLESTDVSDTITNNSNDSTAESIEPTICTSQISDESNILRSKKNTVTKFTQTMTISQNSNTEQIKPNILSPGKITIKMNETIAETSVDVSVKTEIVHSNEDMIRKINVNSDDTTKTIRNEDEFIPSVSDEIQTDKSIGIGSNYNNYDGCVGFLGFHAEKYEDRLNFIRNEIKNLQNATQYDEPTTLLDFGPIKKNIKIIEIDSKKELNLKHVIDTNVDGTDRFDDSDMENIDEIRIKTEIESESDRQIESGSEFDPKIDAWFELSHPVSVSIPCESIDIPIKKTNFKSILTESTVSEFVSNFSEDILQVLSTRSKLRHKRSGCPILNCQMDHSAATDDSNTLIKNEQCGANLIGLDQTSRVKPFHRSLQCSSKIDSSMDPFQEEISKSQKQTHHVSVDYQDGPVFCSYYVDGTLILIQEYQIGFWKQTPLGNVLGASNMWYPIGKTKRYVFEKGCVCRRALDMVSSKDGSVAYIEVWTKEHSSEYRQLPVTDIFVTVYHHKGYGALDKKVLQLENIKGYGKNVQYCVMRCSREIVVSWRDQLDPNKTYIRSFELAPDFQTIINIRELKNVYEELTSMHVITSCDSLVIGATVNKLFVWNVQHGWLVKTIDFTDNSPMLERKRHLCLRALCETGYLFVVQQTKKRFVRLVGVNGSSGQWKQLQLFRLPRNYNTLLGTSTESGMLMLSYPNGFLCYDMQSGKLLAETEFHPDRIVLPADKFLVYVTENGVNVKHVMLHILEYENSQDDLQDDLQRIVQHVTKRVLHYYNSTTEIDIDLTGDSEQFEPKIEPVPTASTSNTSRLKKKKYSFTKRFTKQKDSRNVSLSRIRNNNNKSSYRKNRRKEMLLKRAISRRAKKSKDSLLARLKNVLSNIIPESVPKRPMIDNALETTTSKVVEQSKSEDHIRNLNNGTESNCEKVIIQDRFETFVQSLYSDNRGSQN